MRINAAVVHWAMERRGLTINDLPKSVRHVANELPYVNAQKLARALHIPFGYLFLSSLPPDDMPLPDLRTRMDKAPENPSPDLLEVVNDVMRRQEWYRENQEEIGAKPLSFAKKYTAYAPASDVAADMRKVLGVDESLRRKCSSWDEYLTQLTRQTETAGILVMRSGVVKHDTTRPLSAEEVQGFALYDDLAPVIFINTKDAVAARIFTLAHEVAHIWIGESGISAPGRITETSAQQTARIERLCHSVAAEFLVPKIELWQMWPQNNSNILNLVSQFAREFWVSRIVVLRRAFELQLITDREFFSAVKVLKSQEKPAKKTEGGNPYFTVPARNSVRFTDSVLSALREHRLVHTDAAVLLSLSQSFLLKLARKRIGV